MPSLRGARALLRGKCIVEAISGHVMPTELIIEMICRSMEPEVEP